MNSQPPKVSVVRRVPDVVPSPACDPGGHGGSNLRGVPGARPAKAGDDSGELWPELQGAKHHDRNIRRLTLAQGALLARQPSAGYQPTTEGGKSLQRIQTVDDIKRNVESEQFDALDEACYQLEETLDRMEKVRGVVPSMRNPGRFWFQENGR